jgi:signal transduction histidine kinase/CheY-like chemotaxis protein
MRQTTTISKHLLSRFSKLCTLSLFLVAILTIANYVIHISSIISLILTIAILIILILIGLYLLRPVIIEIEHSLQERIETLEILDKERASLAQRVKERTAELTTANAELARAARLKDEFLANMSHELRTPLNAILGMSEMLQEGIYGNLDEKQTKSVHTIEESGRHLLSLINDILDLAKIEAGKVKLDIIPVSVPSISQLCLRLIRQLAVKKRLKTLSNYDNEVNIIQADERYLKQILLNLLSNAVKFTPKGGTINLEIVGDIEQNIVNITVSDTGIGIAEKDMEFLFKPFVQIDGGLNRVHEGTGLGLSLVYRLTELHGGSIYVKSQIDKGSKFTVSLPWKEINPDQMKQSPQIISNATILIVDDNPKIIQILSDFLETITDHIIIAGNGIQAIEKTKEVQADIILMDLQMPTMDGLEAIRQIRKYNQTIPIIAMTALIIPGDKERTLEAGANQYLTKPLNLHTLLNNISSLL